MANNDIQGTVTDENGNPISGATVVTFEQGNVTNVAETTTDANGEYLFDNGDISGDGPWHVVARYDDGSGKYNGLSKPYIQGELLS